MRGCPRRTRRCPPSKFTDIELPVNAVGHVGGRTRSGVPRGKARSPRPMDCYLVLGTTPQGVFAAARVR